uniref:Uncharacterized protein n=1 Tax=Rhizophora mucronata TaxID=61149 RepID=A0A2P2Q848_RHIMU
MKESCSGLTSKLKSKCLRVKSKKHKGKHAQWQQLWDVFNIKSTPVYFYNKVH